MRFIHERSVPDAASRPSADAALRAVWLCLLIVGGVGSSFFFACATPFVALATLAAVKMDRRDGLIVVGSVWLANQAIGFGLLGYPLTLDSLAWGVAIGAAGVLAMGAAKAFASPKPVPLALTLPFVAAFVVYELALYVAGLALGAGQDGFSLAIVQQVFVINAVGFLVLLAAHGIARTIGLLSGTPEAPMMAAPSR